MILLGDLFVSFVFFCKNTLGIIKKPYETYRRISFSPHISELFFIGLLMTFYFAIAALVKTDNFRPYFITKEFVFLLLGGVVTYFLVVLTIHLFGTILGKSSSLARIAVLWGYTLIPTFLWFIFTSLLYIILPPPRLDSVKGNIFSIFYLVISSTLFFWKIVLYYLTLRFGLKLDFVKILYTSLVILPLFFLYSIWMYKLGIFKIPFI